MAPQQYQIALLRVRGLTRRLEEVMLRLTTLLDVDAIHAAQLVRNTPLTLDRLMSLEEAEKEAKALTRAGADVIVRPEGDDSPLPKRAPSGVRKKAGSGRLPPRAQAQSEAKPRSAAPVAQGPAPELATSADDEFKAFSMADSDLFKPSSLEDLATNDLSDEGDDQDWDRLLGAGGAKRDDPVDKKKSDDSWFDHDDIMLDLDVDLDQSPVDALVQPDRIGDPPPPAGIPITPAEPAKSAVPVSAPPNQDSTDTSLFVDGGDPLPVPELRDDLHGKEQTRATGGWKAQDGDSALSPTARTLKSPQSSAYYSGQFLANAHLALMTPEMGSDSPLAKHWFGAEIWLDLPHFPKKVHVLDLSLGMIRASFIGLLASGGLAWRRATDEEAPNSRGHAFVVIAKVKALTGAAPLETMLLDRLQAEPLLTDDLIGWLFRENGKTGPGFADRMIEIYSSSHLLNSVGAKQVEELMILEQKFHSEMPDFSKRLTRTICKRFFQR